MFLAAIAAYRLSEYWTNIVWIINKDWAILLDNVGQTKCDQVICVKSFAQYSLSLTAKQYSMVYL